MNKMTLKICIRNMFSMEDMTNPQTQKKLGDMLACVDRLVDRDEYIAVKLWSREDVADMLESEGYAGCDENIDAVINSGELEALNDCTDQDWMVIQNAVCNTAKTTGLKEGKFVYDEAETMSMSHSAFILTTVCGREISTLKVDTLKEAKDAMAQEFADTLGISVRKIPAYLKECDLDVCDFGCYFAYCESANHDNCDWKISEIVV